MFRRNHTGRNLTTVFGFLALTLGLAVLPTAGQETLTASDSDSFDLFGWSVSINGDVVLIGVLNGDDACPPDYENCNSGSAYVYRLEEGTWIEEAKLAPSTPAPGSRFGECVSISGDVAVIGASGDDEGGNNAGAAYVFRRDDNSTPGDPSDDSWGQEAKLIAFDAAANDIFGISCVIEGDVVIVGANNDDDNGTASGSAYIFERNAGGTDNWGQVAKLVPGDLVPGDNFGESVSISGNVAVIGARHFQNGGSGAAYVFEKTAGIWTQRAKLAPSDGGYDDRFGAAVSISADVILVGAWHHATAGPFAGAAYIFERPSGGWDSVASPIHETARLTASDAAAFDQFAFSVSISGDVAVVGARQDAVDVCSDTLGSCFSDSDCALGACDGSSGLSCHRDSECPIGGCSLFGDPCTDDFQCFYGDQCDSPPPEHCADGAYCGLRSGSAYVFKKPASGWMDMTETAKLTPPLPAEGNEFGWSVAVGGNSVVIGAFGDTIDSIQTGAAYVFSLLDSDDTDGDGICDQVDSAPGDAAGRAFSDGTTSGVLRGTASIDLCDAALPEDGVEVTSSAATSGLFSELCGCSRPGPDPLSCVDIRALESSTFVLTCGSVIVDVLSGSVGAEFTIDGIYTHELIVYEGGVATVEETVGPDGELLAVSITAAGTDGAVTIDGLVVVPGQDTSVLGVVIDIKPGSYPNSINLGSNGSVPVAIFSSPTFDATLVDPLTVGLAGANVNIIGQGMPQTSISDVNEDGLLDLIVHIETEALELTDGDVEAVLTGSADQDADGVTDATIHGVDSINVVP